MWWSLQEEMLQQEAEIVWAVFPESQPGLPDIADNLGEAEDNAGDLDGEDPLPAFPWHLPEGEPDPVNALPHQNGFHHGPEGGLLGAVQLALAGLGQPPAANGQPG